MRCPNLCRIRAPVTYLEAIVVYSVLGKGEVDAIFALSPSYLVKVASRLSRTPLISSVLSID